METYLDRWWGPDLANTLEIHVPRKRTTYRPRHLRHRPLLHRPRRLIMAMFLVLFLLVGSGLAINEQAASPSATACHVV